MRILILRECAHSCRDFLRVVADDVGEQESICHAVCDVVERAELVGQGVVDSQEGICKCHTCEAGCIGHMVAGRDVRAVSVSGRQIVKYEFGRLE